MAGGAASSTAWRVCLGVALLLHAAFFLMGMPDDVRAGGPRPGASQAVQVRQIGLPDGDAGEEASLSTLPEPVALQRSERFAAELPAVVAPQSLDPLPPGDDDVVYLPRRELDEPPRPLAPIDLLWPASGPPAGRFAEVVSLFIDEAGTVQRVRIDGSGLPDVLAAIVQETFLQARYSPGRLAGRPVRSWIRLEVVFDTSMAAASRGVPR